MAFNLTHVFENEVNVFVVIGPMDVEQSDYVGVIAKMLQEHDFTEGSLGVGLIPESVCTHTHREKKGIRIKSNINAEWSISHEVPLPTRRQQQCRQQQNTHVTIRSLPSVT